MWGKLDDRNEWFLMFGFEKIDWRATYAVVGAAFGGLVGFLVGSAVVEFTPLGRGVPLTWLTVGVGATVGAFKSLKLLNREIVESLERQNDSEYMKILAASGGLKNRVNSMYVGTRIALLLLVTWIIMAANGVFD